MKSLSPASCVNWATLLYILSTLPTVWSGGRRRGRIQRSDASATDILKTEIQRSYFPAVDDDGTDDDALSGLVGNDVPNQSTTEEEAELYRQKQIDPKGSWLSFVKYSDDRLSDSKPERRKKKRNKKKKKKNRNKMLHGPPGPEGPAGPQGPPGISVSKEEILADLRNLIQESAEKRAKELLTEMIAAHNVTSIPQPGMMAPGSTVVPRIYAGFSMKLSSKTRVRRKTFMELRNFQQPFGSGSFQRGDTFNAREGRFVSPREGVYQFTANLHLRVRSKRKPKGRTKLDESLKVVICIDSLCQTNTSVETITGLDLTSSIFTTTVNGILHLKEKQYVSVYLDNSSTFNVLVLQGSDYSGFFLGE